MKPSRQASVRRAKYRQRNPAQTFSVDVDVEGVLAFITATQEELEAAARPVAQAGAQILYEAVLRNVNARGRVTGSLAHAIYQAYSTHDSTPAKAVYHVSWNPRKAPHAHLIEFGHIQKYKAYLGKDGHWYTNKKAPLASPVQIAARPFMRPAMALFPAVEAAMKEKFYEVMGHVL